MSVCARSLRTSTCIHVKYVYGGLHVVLQTTAKKYNKSDNARARCSNTLHKVGPSSTFYNIFFSTYNTEIFARQVKHALVIRATTRSTCNATTWRDKLNKNVARISGP